MWDKVGGGLPDSGMAPWEGPLPERWDTGGACALTASQQSPCLEMDALRELNAILDTMGGDPGSEASLSAFMRWPGRGVSCFSHLSPPCEPGHLLLETPPSPPQLLCKFLVSTHIVTLAT